MGFGDGIPVSRKTCRFAGKVDVDELGQDRLVVWVVSTRISEGRLKMLRGDMGEQQLDMVAAVQDAVPLSGEARDKALLFLAHSGEQGVLDFPVATDAPEQPEQLGPDFTTLTTAELMAIVREGGEWADAAEEEVLSRTSVTPSSETDVGEDLDVPPEEQTSQAAAVNEQVSESARSEGDAGGAPEDGATPETDVPESAREPTPESSGSMSRDGSAGPVDEQVRRVLDALGQDPESPEPAPVDYEPVGEYRPHLNDYRRGRRGRPREGVKPVTQEDLDRIGVPSVSPGESLDGVQRLQ